MGTSKRNTTSAAPKALSAKDVAAFLDYGYVPFRKAQCVGRIFIVLLSGAGLCLIRERSLLWAVPVGLLSLLITAAFIVLMVRFSRLRISRYLCDGIFGLYIAVIMNLGAYRCTALQAGSSVLRLIAMLGLRSYGPRHLRQSPFHGSEPENSQTRTHQSQTSGCRVCSYLPAWGLPESSCRADPSRRSLRLSPGVC